MFSSCYNLLKDIVIVQPLNRTLFEYSRVKLCIFQIIKNLDEGLSEDNSAAHLSQDSRTGELLIK